MNAATKKENRRYVLEMRGFSDAEKSMLQSTFRLTSRREMCYIEPSDVDVRADIYLINGDNLEAIEELANPERSTPNLHSPAVIIGRTAIESPWAFIAKPIHWMRLFEMLDEAMQQALRERSRRTTPAASTWNGDALRRVSDQKALQKSVEEPTAVSESVLVVDDSATVRAFMRIKLEPFQFDVDFAETGEQAVEMANQKNYTCIFLDIMMPGIDGYEVCKRMKSHADTKKAAVVMLTSKSSMIDKFRGTWSGCDAYLSKPVSEDELLATIAKFLPSGLDAKRA